MAATITAGRATDAERALAVFEWTRANVRDVPAGFPFVDDRFWHIDVHHGSIFRVAGGGLLAAEGAAELQMPGRRLWFEVRRAVGAGDRRWDPCALIPSGAGKDATR